LSATVVSQLANVRLNLLVVFSLSLIKSTMQGSENSLQLIGLGSSHRTLSTIANIAAPNINCVLNEDLILDT
jgi:hypothetical protein